MWLALIGMIPGLLSVVSALTTAAFNAKVQLYQIKTGADQDVAVKTIQAAAQADHENTTRLGIIASNKFLTFLLIAFSLPIMLWFDKVVAWDIVLSPIFTGHTGDTDPIKGEALEITKIIVTFLFGTPTALAVSKMWFSRKGE